MLEQGHTCTGGASTEGGPEIFSDIALFLGPREPLDFGYEKAGTSLEVSGMLRFSCPGCAECGVEPRLQVLELEPHLVEDRHRPDVEL